MLKSYIMEELDYKKIKLDCYSKKIKDISVIAEEKENELFFYSYCASPVIDNEYELVDKVINCIQNNCIMEEKYKKRVSDFFEFNDKNNCKRVYEWLYSH